MHPIKMSRFSHAEKKGRKFQNPVETHMGGLGMIFQVLWLYLINKDERSPRKPLGLIKTDPRVFAKAPESGLRVTWMGHSSLLVEIDGVRVLIDPVWDKRASPVTFMGPKRFFPAPLALNDLPLIDVVLISHDHFDHLGKDTIAQLARLAPTERARWITSLGVGKELSGFGVRKDAITELDWTESATVDGLNITALPARHFSGRSLWNRFETLWSSFVLKGSKHNIYYGADSGLWDGFAEIGREYGPFDLTLLEIGAHNKLWEAIHMGPDGAAEAFAAMGGSGLFMPIHWGLFELAPQGWRQPIERIMERADAAGIKVWSPAPGVPTEVILGQEHRSTWWRP
jgi:L-ascorbate metabolism protein UlaG (beta-lactamase superfamily)